jgi:hypothetical protein
VPSGTPNPYAHAEHEPTPGTISAANSTGPGSVPLPKPLLYDGFVGTDCDDSGSYGNAKDWEAANGVSWLSLPVVSYGCVCQVPNSAGGCQQAGGKYLKVLDTMFLGIGAFVLIVSALTGHPILAVLGIVLATFGILNAEFGWVNL